MSTRVHPSAIPDAYRAFEYLLREEPRITYVEPADSKLRRTVIDTVESLLGRDEIQDIYEGLKHQPFDVQRFFSEALAAGNVTLDYDERQLAKVPASGPVVFIANHPFGVMDGVAFCQLALRSRGNFRIMIHALLCQDRDLLPYFLPIDFSGEKAALKTNIASKRVALDTLREDIPVLIFPAGGVSTLDRFGFGELHDLPWTTFAAKLIQQSNATVVPCFFHGRNSRLFHVLSHVSEPLRLALLVHEIRNKFGTRLRVDIGDPIGPEALQAYPNRRALTDALHDIVWALPDRGRPSSHGGTAAAK
ncbi:MAG: lysophospholipid acyltransferase family protein [Pseudomonadota bacterium]